MGFKPGKGEIAETFKISDGSIKVKEQANAEADDDFGFNETTSFFQDSKVRDNTTGDDKLTE